MLDSVKNWDGARSRFQSPPLSTVVKGYNRVWFVFYLPASDVETDLFLLLLLLQIYFHFSTV